MRMDYLSEFVQVAEALSFTSAAQTLHITQSTLSRHISWLENEIGASLFNRTTRSVELTPVGDLLLERMTPVLKAHDEALSEVRKAAGLCGEELRIAFPYYFADAYLQPELDRFSSRCPNAKVKLLPIEPPDAEPMLAQGLCDIAFDIMYPFAKPNAQHHARIVGVERFCVCLSSEHHLAGKDSIEPQDLDGEIFVTASDYAAYDDFIEGFFSRHTINPKRRISAGSVELIYPALIQHTALSLRISGTGIQRRAGIAYVPLNEDLSAKIRIIARKDSANPLVGQFLKS